MSISNTLKKVISVALFTASATTIYSISRLNKKISCLNRDSLQLAREIKKIKKEISEIVKRTHGDNVSKSNAECACKAEDKRKHTHTIKEYNGIIGVFDGDGALIKELDITVDSLPDADKQDLLIGIRVYSSDELEKTLEEFN